MRRLAPRLDALEQRLAPPPRFAVHFPDAADCPPCGGRHVPPPPGVTVRQITLDLGWPWWWTPERIALARAEASSLPQVAARAEDPELEWAEPDEDDA